MSEGQEDGPAPAKVGAWVSFDVEARGVVPGVPGNTLEGPSGPLVMLGVSVLPMTLKACDFAAIADGLQIDRYLAERRQWCVEENCVASNTPGNVKFWKDNPELAAFIAENQIPYDQFLEEFHEFYTRIREKYATLVFIAKPAAYDWQWLTNTYGRDFTMEPTKLPYKALCISTQWEMIERMLPEHQKAIMNKKILEHPLNNGKHYALSDADFQAYIFCVLQHYAHVIGEIAKKIL
jgi:hypothetical protein